MEEKLEGLGGWLSLYILGSFLSVALWFEILLYRSPIDNITQGIILFNIGFTMLTLYFIFKKRRCAPLFAISTMWISFIFSLVIAFWANTYDRIIFVMITTCLWTCYFLLSKRVKNTFVNNSKALKHEETQEESS